MSGWIGVSGRKKMQKNKKLFCGVGINDANYVVQPTINGKRVMCQFYMAWNNMLMRCYSAKFQAKQPTYIGCEVATEWLSFMAFRDWMIMRDWQDRELDKDLLFPGNKVYGPETCVFISSGLNKFANENAAARGEFPLGVYWSKCAGKFRARCSNPFTGENEHLGYFTCPDAAHEAWRKRKHELALQIAALHADPRIAAALSVRYLPENIHKIV
jgi:hypothetical protein